MNFLFRIFFMFTMVLSLVSALINKGNGVRDPGGIHLIRPRIKFIYVYDVVTPDIFRIMRRESSRIDLWLFTPLLGL